MKNNTKVIEVLFSIPVNKGFDYLVSADMKVKKGMRVLADFRGRKCVGIVYKVGRKSLYGLALKEIHTVLDKEPFLTSRQFKVAMAMSKKYVYSLGEIIFMFLPPYLRKNVSLSEHYLPSGKIKNNKKVISTGSIRYIKSYNLDRRFLYYRQMIENTIESGRTVMILVPLKENIGNVLTLCEKYFPQERISVISSYQSDKKNLLEWLSLRRGESSIVVGTKMSLFLYPPTLGLLIVENENSEYYSHQEKPYYHILDVAHILYKNENIDLILSSDYPSLHTYRLIKEGMVNLIDYDGSKNCIEVVDMRRVRTSKTSIFVPFVLDTIRGALVADKRVLIFWNRRGFASILKCSSCGETLNCERCSAFLQYYLSKDKGICPYCGYRKDIPNLCPNCGKGYILPFGLGIERMKNIIQRFFPQEIVSSIEETKDTYPDKDRYGNRRRIILATQRLFSGGIFIKGGVDIAFVLDIDGLLSRFDFDITMKVFLYLKKMEELVRDKIYVLTNNPHHYLFDHINEEWRKFYDQELNIRKELTYPPYGSLIKITFKGKDENKVLLKINRLYDIIKKNKNITVFGPLKEIPFRLRGKYRYSIVIKCGARGKVDGIIRNSLQKVRTSSINVAIWVR